MALFERFTERARQVVVLAQVEARTLKHDHIGTEHLLLGLVHEDKGVAARVLGSLDVTLERTRGEVVRIVGVGEYEASGHIPFTPVAKRVLEQALHEALVLGHNYIGTEHILLGLISLNEGPSVRILADMNVTPDAVRSETLRIIGPSEPGPTGVSREAPPVPRSPEEWFHVGPGSHARRLLMLAASRALADGRSLIEPTDVLLAMTRDEDTGPLLAELGVDEAAVANALRKRRPPNGPPRASARG
ncbi:MAG: Clp protease N-terminal domain-containing protein [Solirubrobacteraceae bacterium]